MQKLTTAVQAYCHASVTDQLKFYHSTSYRLY